MQKLKYLFKKHILYNVDREEKERIRMMIMENDHKSYRVVLAIVILLQFFMFIFNITKYGMITEKRYAYGYRYLYLALCIASIIFFIIMEIAYKQKNALFFFSNVNTYIAFVMLWGVGISLLDTSKNVHFGLNNANLLVYSYVTIALVSFVILEPWIMFLDILGSTLFMVLFLLIEKDFKGSISFGTFINIFSIVIIAFTIIMFNFTKTVSKLKLEIENEKINLKLKENAYIDDLTKTFNRRYLTERIDTVLKTGDKKTGLMMFDLDNFKKVNDTYGHLIGDKCLEILGKHIESFLIDKNGYAIRYGGEEFLIYLDETYDSDLFNYAETFRKDIEKIIIEINNAKKIGFTISIGIALAEENISYSELIDRADTALYEAKKIKNRVSKYNNN